MMAPGKSLEDSQMNQAFIMSQEKHMNMLRPET